MFASFIEKLGSKSQTYDPFSYYTYFHLHVQFPSELFKKNTVIAPEDF